MERLNIHGRTNWQEIVEAEGFLFHSIGGPYWSEQVGYQMRPEEVHELESATNELHRICLEAVDRVIRFEQLAQFGIPEKFRPLVRESWRQQDPSVYGRFDLRYDGQGPPKLYEYNADTPTSLLEASRIQASWKSTLFSGAGQFNRIEDLLIDAWRRIAPRHPQICFSSVAAHCEDMGNVEYMRSLAARAGISTRFLFVEELSWNPEARRFVGPDTHPVDTWFKLYPWEWILDDDYAEHLLERPICMIEPAWKMIMSSKAILPVLWEMYPNHPNLLPAYFSESPLNGRFVRKPIYGREGSNISIHDGAVTRYVPGPYGSLPSIYQSYCPLPQFSKLYTLIGSWVIGGKAAGIGIRESVSVISENRSRFVPHFVQ